VNKKQCSRLFLVVGITVLVVPLFVYTFFPYSLIRAMRVMHIPLPQGFDEQWWLYIGAFFLCLTGFLQFPFKEEEGWTCACGYDLSYLDTKSKVCSECGQLCQVEWTPAPGEYSRQTKRRFNYTILLFFVAAMFTFIGIWVDITHIQPR